MKALWRDGDVGLLVLVVAAGVLPIIGDVLHGQPLGVEATLGALMVVAGAVGLSRRLTTLVRAEALRKRLLRR
ncbi:MAG: hypothetical protein JNK82_00200 [Myxococcaceae bacterium]|nr:hypothetical protein [Myxococcaceae bacterium]